MPYRLNRPITEQDLRVLQFVQDNPGSSKTAVYVATSDACQRRGLKRSVGTYGWTRPATMEARGLIRFDIDDSRCVPNRGLYYNRFLRVNRWFITEKGKAALRGEVTRA